MQTFQIESQADQAPLASGGGQAAQGELAEAQDFFDEANYRLYRAFAQPVNVLLFMFVENVKKLLIINCNSDVDATL